VRLRTYRPRIIIRIFALFLLVPSMKSASFIFDRRLYELLQEPGRTSFTTRELRDAYAARLSGTQFRIADVRRYVYEQIRRLVRAGWVSPDGDRRVRGQVYHLQPIPVHLQLELVDNGFERSLMAAGVPEPETAVRDVELLRHDEVINPILDLGCSKLNELRQIKPDAAGLVVATDIEHAQQIALALEAMGEECRIVTNKTPDAQQVINAFRSSACRWIVAVGMISEGTDIPRLQVCCYLSRIRTELHYRQVLGRVLRRTGESDDQAWLFMLAEPTLQGFAERIADDLPDDLAVLRDVQMPGFNPGSRPEPMGTLGHVEGFDGVGLGSAEPGIGSQPTNIISLGGYAIEPAYQVSFSQHYRQQLLACF